jgi:8-oxo-dGTP diphosphatase
MSTPHEVTVAGFDWIHWEPVDRAVLLFLFRGREVLLIHKKRGLGKGKINGPGGRLEPGESFAQAAIRETLEETGVSVSDLEEVAELSFVFVDGHSIYARVFFAYEFTGEPMETDEADPFWHPFDKLPFEQMWEDDKEWLPPTLEGKYVRGKFIFDGDKMQDIEIQCSPRESRR